MLRGSGANEVVRMRVTDGQYVLVPLYHGTSKRFLPSIREFGLGGRYPDEVTQCHRLLDDLASVEELDWLADPDLCILRPMVDRMRRQTVTAGGLNFRYGNTYLSASNRTAVRYATSNRYGSELLSTAMSVLEKLFDHDPAHAQAIAERHQISPDLRRAAKQPVLVEANRVPLRSLKSERGEAADVVLDEMQRRADTLPDLPTPVLWDQSNFELTSPMPSEMLRCYDIRCEGNSHDCQRFTLEEIP